MRHNLDDNNNNNNAEGSQVTGFSHMQESTYVTSSAEADLLNENEENHEEPVRYKYKAAKIFFLFKC